MSSIVRFSTLMLLMRYVDIEFNGFWSLFLIIIAFYTTTHGGVLNGYLIRIPMFMERSRYRTCQSLHDQAMISLLMTLGLGIIGLGVYLSYQSSIDLSYFEILLLLLIAGLSYLTFYIEISFTAQNHYRAYSLWLGWTSLIQLILVLTGTTLGGRIGFCLGYSTSLCIGLIGAYSRLRFRLRFSHIKWIYLLKTGFPMTLSGWISSLILTLDRLILGIFYTPLACGYYYLCFISGSLFLMLPRVLQRVNLTDWGSLRTNSRSIHAEMCRQILIYSITAIILGLIVYQITPGFIHQFFPHYEPGITALFYLLPGLLLYGIREILFGYLMLKKKRSLAVGFDSLTLITSFALYWIIHRFFSASIEGIAAATSLSYSFNTLLYIGYILRTEGLSFGPTGTETG